MRVNVWDLPTRLFHWALACAVAGSLVTGLLGGNLMEWHGRIGLLIFGLIVFRLVWGLVGSTYARFSSFVPTPRSLMAYLAGRWNGLGHSPLGALSVFALLALMSWQASTGLFSNDDIAFDGPLAVLIDKSLSDQLTGLHRQGLWVIVGLVSLHVVAVMFYVLIRGNDLIRPMILGWKDSSLDAPLKPAGIWVLAVAVAIAVAAVWIAAGGLLTPPPPPPPQAIPAW
jgi:cytochrome b